MHNYEIGPVTDPGENVCYCTTVQASSRLHKILLMACLYSYVTGTFSSPRYSCLKLSMAQRQHILVILYHSKAILIII